MRSYETTVAASRQSPTLKGQFNFILAYVRANLAMALEYRVSFAMQVVGMILNNVLWVCFWAFFFQRFPVLNGWTLSDVITLWAIATFSFGLGFGLFANLARLPELITQGHLDYYLALPQNVLLHIAVSQIRPVTLGDMFFGPILFLIAVSTAWDKVGVFLLAGALAAVIFASFNVIVGSLAFFLGQSESLASGLANTLIHFSTYPTRIFDGWARVLLYTVIPAGFIAEIPVELVRSFSWLELGRMAGAAAVFAVVAIVVFHIGLRRYESGNLIAMRS